MAAFTYMESICLNIQRNIYLNCVIWIILNSMPKRYIQSFKTQQEAEARQTRQNNRQVNFQARITSRVQPQANIPVDSRHERREKELKEFESRIEELQKVDFTVEMLDGLVLAVRENDIFRNHHGIFGLRKIWSRLRLPGQQLINQGLVVKLIKFGALAEYPKLQQRSVEIILYMTQSGQGLQLIQAGGFNLCLALLHSPKEAINKLSLLIIRQMSSYDTNRNKVVGEGGLDQLAEFFQGTQNQELRMEVCRTLVQILIESDPYPFPAVRKALKVLYCHVDQMAEDDNKCCGYLSIFQTYSKGVEQAKFFLQEGCLQSILYDCQGQPDHCLAIMDNLAYTAQGIYQLLELDFQSSIVAWDVWLQQTTDVYIQIARTLSQSAAMSRVFRPRLTDITKHLMFGFPEDSLQIRQRLCSALIWFFKVEQQTGVDPEASDQKRADFVSFIFECMSSGDEEHILSIFKLIEQGLIQQNQFQENKQLGPFAILINRNKRALKVLSKLGRTHSSESVREAASFIREELLTIK